jgi:hypothetical protein
MNAQQAPRITTPPARFRAVRRGLAVVALILLPFAVIGHGAAEAMPNNRPYCTTWLFVPFGSPLCLIWSRP